jgi:hypothetical protein
MSKLVTTSDITQYVSEINRIYKAGNATEHSYRPALKSLFEKMTDGLTVTNEPKRIACGAPDYIVTRKEIPVGYIEAKDIDTDLNHKANKPQFDRYKQSLDNLIITVFSFFCYPNGSNLFAVYEKLKGNIIGNYQIVERLFVTVKLRFVSFVVQIGVNILCLNISHRQFFFSNDVIGRSAGNTFGLVGNSQTVSHFFQ